MSHETQTRTSGETDFLMKRYDQLLQEQLSTNRIIHTTFYLSIVVVGALIGALTQSSTFVTRAVVTTYVAGVFFAMFLWTRTYLNSRQEITEHMAAIIDGIESAEIRFERIGSVDRFFSDPADYRRDSWEKGWTKERLLLAYYVALSLCSLTIPLVELLIST